MNSFIFDIWLHVGREGRCFSYYDGNNLDIDLGDVVTVRLKGQLMQGLVVNKMKKNISISKENLNNTYGNSAFFGGNNSKVQDNCAILLE